MEEENNSNVAALAAIARQAASSIYLHNGDKTLIVPEGYKVVDYPAPEKPRNIERQVEVVEADSFIAYLLKYKSEHTHLTSSASRGNMHAVLDYHGPNAPDNCDHTLFFQPVTSDEWNVWALMNGSWQDQSAFMEFLEENLTDIVTPDGAMLLDMVRTFQGTKKIEFRAGVNNHDGTVQMKWSETIENGRQGELLIPTEMELAIPVFQGDLEAYKIRVFLRHRIQNDGTVNFCFKLHRAPAIKRQAFRLLRERTEEETGLTALQM